MYDGYAPLPLFALFVVLHPRLHFECALFVMQMVARTLTTQQLISAMQKDTTICCFVGKEGVSKSSFFIV